jgi:hypothetical protein
MSRRDLSRSDLLALHEAAQDNANHYNQINWVLHAIAIAGISGVSVEAVKTLAVSPASINDLNLLSIEVGSLIKLSFSGALCALISYGWEQIYLSHKKIINICYDTLKDVEATLSESGPGYVLHLEINERYEALQKNEKTRSIKTSTIISTTQKSVQGIGVFFCVMGAVLSSLILSH